MLDRSDVIYSYDGSFDGLMCCIFESYQQKEIPWEIRSPDMLEAALFPVKTIAVDYHKARRVRDSIPEKMGHKALEFVEHAFLTCLPQKEMHILRFVRLGYRCGPAVMDMLTHDAVNILFKAVRHLHRESHLFKGFLRFSIYQDVLIGIIEPKNLVLPLITQHFCERFPEERFFIYDKTHGMAIVYQPYESAIIEIESLELFEPNEEEKFYRELWQLFYDAIEVEGRHNPRCRMSHMPKRYWKHMTEFDRPADSRPSSRFSIPPHNEPLK